MYSILRSNIKVRAGLKACLLKFKPSVKKRTNNMLIKSRRNIKPQSVRFKQRMKLLLLKLNYTH